MMSFPESAPADALQVAAVAMVPAALSSSDAGSRRFGCETKPGSPRRYSSLHSHCGIVLTFDFMPDGEMHVMDRAWSDIHSSEDGLITCAFLQTHAKAEISDRGNESNRQHHTMFPYAGKQTAARHPRPFGKRSTRQSWVNCQK